MPELLERLRNSIVHAYSSLFASDTGLHGLFLCSALVIAMLIYSWRDAGSRPTLRGMLQFCFPARIFLHRSATLDYRYVAVNALLSVTFLAPFLLSVSFVSHQTWMGLRFMFGEAVPFLAPGIAADVCLTIAVVLAGDLGFYVAHWLVHRVDFLWQFHKVHHSAEVLQPLTAYRAHPMDSVVSTTCLGTASGIAFGTFYFLCGGEVDEIRFFGLNIITFLFTTAGFNLRHTHVWISYGKTLNRLFISPAHHQIHHSAAPRHANKNLGLVFSFWDQLFGTHYAPDLRETLTFGLGNRKEGAEYRSVLRLYLLPFREVGRSLRSQLRSRSRWGLRRPAKAMGAAR